MQYGTGNLSAPFNPFMGYEVATTMTCAMFHAMSEWNREVAKFVGHRLEMDARLQAELATCTNAFDAFDTVSKFMQTASADYAREARNVQELSVAAAEETLETMGAGLTSPKAPVLE